jgi:hypothetical protein
MNRYNDIIPCMLSRAASYEPFLAASCPLLFFSRPTLFAVDDQTRVVLGGEGVNVRDSYINASHIKVPSRCGSFGFRSSRRALGSKGQTPPVMPAVVSGPPSRLAALHCSARPADQHLRDILEDDHCGTFLHGLPPLGTAASSAVGLLSRFLPVACVAAAETVPRRGDGHQRQGNGPQQMREILARCPARGLVSLEHRCV